MSTIHDVEFFLDKEGYIILAVSFDGGNGIDYKTLIEFQKDNKEEGIYAEKVLKNAVWPIYPDPRPYMDWEDLNLLLDIERIIREYIYLPREELYNTLALWILYTYIHDRPEFTQAPRILVHGLRTTGKSRLLSLLSFLAYRGFVVDDPTEAGLFRVIEKFHATPFIDEIQRLQKEQRANVEGLIVAGFDRGRKILRGSADSEWPIVYDVYAPLCAGGMKWSPPDEIVQRGIKIETTKRPKGVVLPRRAPGLSDVRDLRARLLAFRLKVISGVIPLEPYALEVEEAIEEKVFIENKEITLDDRGLDIAYALGIPGAIFDDYQDMLKEVARTQAKAIDATRNTFESDVFQALVSIVEEKLKSPQSKISGEVDKNSIPSMITTRDVAEQLNLDLDSAGNAPDKPIHTRTVTKLLENTYCFDLKKKGGAGGTTTFDPETFWERFARNQESMGYD